MKVAASTLPPLRTIAVVRPASGDPAGQCGRERNGAARLDDEPEVTEGRAIAVSTSRIADREDAGEQLAVDRERESCPAARTAGRRRSNAPRADSSASVPAASERRVSSNASGSTPYTTAFGREPADRDRRAAR